MKKLSIIVAIVVSYLLVMGFNAAYATKPCPPGQERKGWKCVDIEQPSGDITNTNSNRNTNTNINNNKADANATAIQGQVQLQGQLQGQSQNAKVDSTIVNDITIKDQRQTVQTIIDFNHIAPNIGKTDANMISGFDTDSGKTVGMYGRILTLDRKSATRMGKDTTDYKVFDSTMFENDFRTTMIGKGVASQMMGTVTFVADGGDVTVDGLFARAMLYGMDLGATHFEILKVTSGIYHEGSKAGIDFGGSASVAVKSDGSAVVAPGSTLGYSKAWSNNEYRPSMVVMFSFESSYVITPAN